MSDMSDGDDKQVAVELFDRIADLPHEVLWQEVADQLGKMFYDLEREDILKALMQGNSDTTCLDPDNGVIMWLGQVYPEVPSVRIEVRGPLEGAPLREWQCKIHYVTSADVELTDVGSMKLLMLGARLLAFRQFVHELNNKSPVGN